MRDESFTKRLSPQGGLLRCTCLFLLTLTIPVEVLCAGGMGEIPVSLSATRDTLRIGLEDAILMALEHNSTVTIQRLEPLIRHTYIEEERADFDPMLTASGALDRSKIQRRLGSQSTPFDLTDRGSQYDLEIEEVLPTGTTISAGVSMGSSISSLYTDQYTGRMELSVTQSLLQGFGIGTNLAELRKACIDVDIEKAELRAVAGKLVADVENAYWDLYLTAKETDIRERSLELAERQLVESLERVAVGQLPELELAAVHAEVASRRESLIDAQSSHEQARLRFIFLLNPPNRPGWNTIPVLADTLLVPSDTLDDISIHEKLGLKYRSDLQQARFELERGSLNVKQTRNGLLPKLDLFITLGRTTYAQSYREAVSELQSPYYDASAGLSVSLPVRNREARAEAARARWSEQQLRLSLENMERLIQRDVRSAHIEVLRARQQIEATGITRDLQKRKLEAEQEKFRVGKSTNFLVLQAQRDFTGSRLDHASSIVLYIEALVQLYLMEGTLLDRRRIDTGSLFTSNPE